MNCTLIKNKNKQYNLKFHATRSGYGYLFMKISEDEALKKFAANKTNARLAGQSFITSTGILAPIASIPNVLEIKISDIASYESFDSSWTTTQKGAWAQNICVHVMTQNGESPIIITDRDRQIAGQDIYLSNSGLYIQCKCDSRGGRWPAGTGNLYLETSEINMRNDW